MGFLSVALGVYFLILGTWGASVQGRMVDLASAPLCSWFTCFCHWLDHARVITWAWSPLTHRESCMTGPTEPPQLPPAPSTALLYVRQSTQLPLRDVILLSVSLRR